MEFLKKNSKMMAWVGCLLMLIGNFLPFAKVSVTLLGTTASQSVKFIDGDGKFVIICAIAAAILIYMKKTKLTLIPTIIGLGIIIYNMINADSVVGGASYGLGKVSFGFGCWIMLIGCICAVSYALLQEDGFLTKIAPKSAFSSNDKAN